MELTDFALRVLMSESLEEKLAPPAGPLTDDRPGPAICVPESPGRPADLRMARRGQRAEIPSETELHRDESRAVLLHAFANHELLATELMALAILRFPDAPKAFRRALLQTLREEQIHTRLYMERMARCGLAFGDLPVNGFFWRHIAGMESPVDYVSRLSLTFEQANLDYSRHFAGVFSRMGDDDTAALMERIYEDEVGHVGCGLHWFRKWKQPDESDWDAWRRVLRFPLNPSRARGNVPFNAEGRRRAGLDDAFIESLRVFSHSRGRTPGVYLFNPAAERSALTGITDPLRADPVTTGLAEDLDLLPLLICHEEDLVLVRKSPSPSHLRSLLDAGLHSAEFETLDVTGHIASDSPLRSRKLGSLRPWAWSADSSAVLQPLAEGARNRIPWNEGIRQLYAKSTAAALLASLRDVMPAAADLAGITATDFPAAAAAVAHWLDAGYYSVVIKAPWGLAGRSLVRMSAAPGSSTSVSPSPQEVWIRNTLTEQGAVVVEPWLDRAADFSIHYDVTPDQPPTLRGMVRLHNDNGGRFIACTAARMFSRLMPSDCARLLHETGAAAFYRDILPARLAPILQGTGFTGPLGIDAFIHRLPDGQLQLRPVVEINPRCTMGRVTLEARRFAASESPVTWRIWHRKHATDAGCTSLAEFAGRIRKSHPVILDPSPPRPRLVSGAVCLNDPLTARQFLGVLYAGCESPPPPP